MEQNLKNIVILGACSLFIVMFYGFFEIRKSQNLIDIANDPMASMNRGFSDAEEDFEDGSAHFIKLNDQYLGLNEAELLKIPEKYTYDSWHICGFGLHYDTYALNLRGIERNEHYISAYNTRLKRLVISE